MSAPDRAAAVSTDDEEQRRHARVAVELPVAVFDTGNRVQGSIRFDMRDLSLGGAFLRSDLLFEIGDDLWVEFVLPDGATEPRAIRARGRVVRVSRGGAGAPEAPGMAIAFTHMAERDREAVQRFLGAA
jgi:c-di-GMP-binding flagellar brake protein YcgR